jgi:hypothetical protein
MASSTKNVKLGVCQIFFDNVDLGYTQGGVEVSVTTETYKSEVDQFGKTPINEFIQGRQVSVKAPLAETTLRNLVKIMPGSTLFTDGVLASATLTFSAQPVVSSIVTIGGQAFTFVSTNPTNVFQVRIGANQAATLQNLVDAVNLSQIEVARGGVIAEVNVAGTIVTLRCGDPGTQGNAITLVAGSAPQTNAVASSATFVGGVAETRARVDVTDAVGVDMLAIAKTLRLHPKGKAATDYSDDFVIHRTATPGALQFAYKVDAERIFNAEFMGYPDPVTNRLFSVGDPAAV